jgi:hypothetical protein
MNTDKRWNDINEYFERQEKEIQDYRNWDEETRQKLWTWYIFQLLQGHRWSSQTHEPELIDFADFRKNNKFWEENPDKYLPWVIEELYWLYDENALEMIFTLDEKAKKYLEVHLNLTFNSEQVWSAIDWDNVKKNKTSKIDWVDLSNEELAEKIWDLFYDSLGSFLSSLWDILSKDNEFKQIWEYLKIASNHIMNAWNICLPYVWEWFPNLKHSTEIKWLNISREELVEKLWNLTSESLKEFLLNLSKKIHKDWLADEWRWRKKLSNELFETAKNLEIAWNLL